MNRIFPFIAAFCAVSQLYAHSPSCPLDMVPQKYAGVDISTPVSAPVSYGSSFEVKLEGVKRNGKKKALRPDDRHFQLEIEGGWIDGNTVFVTNRPEVPGFYAVKVKVRQKGFLGAHVVDSLVLPLNFKQQLLLDFQGKPGDDGKDRMNRFSTPLIGRDGRDGREGTSGGVGSNGQDLSINIVSMYSKDLQSDIYVLEVYVLSSRKTYYFNWIRNDGGITVNAYGGSGGDGGDGGSGGNGKDGEYDQEKDKFKAAGSGGNAGNGGNGGNGGDGGNVAIFLGERSLDILNFITVSNRGGFPGEGGAASDRGGVAGQALYGQYQPADGKPGLPGYDGLPGRDGYYEIHAE